MAPTTSVDALASALVARFLRTNDYSETLQAFIREAGLPSDAGQSSGDDTNNWTIQQLVEEKKAFDHSSTFERYAEDSKENDQWRVPAPSKPSIVSTPSSSNLLAASVEVWQWHCGAEDVAETAAVARPVIVSTGADRLVHLLETTTGNEAVASLTGLSDSPVLSYVSILQGRFVLMTNMSGQLLLLHGSNVVDRRRDHAKYAIQVVAHEEEGETASSRRVWIATAGWDASVCLYRVDIPDGDNTLTIGDPIARIQTTTNPESLLFVRHVDSGELLLLVSRRDSTYIYYYGVGAPVGEIDAPATSPPEGRLLGKQNLAPHSNAWVAFSPAYMALSPHDSGLLAVATSTLPHLKVMFVRLLFPSTESLAEHSSSATDAQVTQASQALEALTLQNREDAAILVQANTFAPQTAYSTPQVAWRPDGSGVWVNGDDGVIRGIEAKTGKIITMLKNGHEAGCKVRTIWAGYVTGPGETTEEWVISGGFDKRLVVWKT
ncbi:hypothetical protein N7492_002360 [Penicillium capsulatum]|uniref:LisH domain-containing protein n=1 Tax=Penicillium capsulatum TaxID=69766 RepID=A0A9W9IIE3_9EURO|nr:hypothetical protein N7492_002360 [Penicillium capsulatum]KAJ6123034.1 hypothetical protein N7512_005499 [Penicillium capsulatum]